MTPGRPLPGDPDFAPPPDLVLPLDLDAVDARLRQRARRRSLVQGGVLALVLVVGLAAIPWSGVRGRVELATAPQLEVTDVDPAHLPTWLPPGYEVCGATRQVGEVRRTRLCTTGAPDLVLDQGPHWALPEVGETLVVARRTGHLRRSGDQTVLVVSDGNHLEDVHHALGVSDPAADVDVLIRVLASIPAVRDAPAPR